MELLCFDGYTLPLQMSGFRGSPAGARVEAIRRSPITRNER
jgi:hypothetical protein